MPVLKNALILSNQEPQPKEVEAAAEQPDSVEPAQADESGSTSNSSTEGNPFVEPDSVAKETPAAKRRKVRPEAKTEDKW